MSDSAKFTVTMDTKGAFRQDPDKGLEILRASDAKVLSDDDPNGFKSWGHRSGYGVGHFEADHKASGNYYLQGPDGSPQSLQYLNSKLPVIETRATWVCRDCLRSESEEPGGFVVSLYNIEVEQEQLILSYSVSESDGCNHHPPEGEMTAAEWGGDFDMYYLGNLLIERITQQLEKSKSAGMSGSRDARIFEELLEPDETVVEVDGKPTKISFKAYSGN